MIEILGVVAPRLPLDIEHADWGDPMLSIGGHEWAFHTMSAWRVSKIGGGVLFACEDPAGGTGVSEFVGKRIIRVRVQSDDVAVDPRFEFEDGTVLEIFSSSTFEPWKLTLGDDVFIA